MQVTPGGNLKSTSSALHMQGSTTELPTIMVRCRPTFLSFYVSLQDSNGVLASTTHSHRGRCGTSFRRQESRSLWTWEQAMANKPSYVNSWHQVCQSQEPHCAASNKNKGNQDLCFTRCSCDACCWKDFSHLPPRQWVALTSIPRDNFVHMHKYTRKWTGGWPPL